MTDQQKTDWKPVALLNGTKLIKDLANPKPEEIDLNHIDQAMKKIYRYSNHAKSHNLHQHMLFVACIIQEIWWEDHDSPNPPKEIIDHALNHDCEEGIIGDHPAPYKSQLNALTGGYVNHISEKLREAIYTARGIAQPSLETIKYVKKIDYTTAVYSWRKLLKRKEEWPAYIQRYDDGSVEEWKCEYPIKIEEWKLTMLNHLVKQASPHSDINDAFSYCRQEIIDETYGSRR